LPTKHTKEGFLLHQILPRTLQHLSESHNLMSQDDQDLDAILAEHVEEGAGAADQDWSKMLVTVTAHLTFAEINQKRKQLAFEAFRKDDFMPRTLLLEVLVEPLVTAMDRLFERTGAISALHHLPSLQTEEHTKLMERPGMKVSVMVHGNFSSSVSTLRGSYG
jgi:hypothetical protein